MNTPSHLRPDLVLLVDDDSVFAQQVEALLSGTAQLLWLGSSKTAIEMIRSERPSLILLDLNMPRHFAALDEEEGLELLKKLEGEDRARVLIVTQSVTPSTRRRLEELGIRRIYLKSASLSELAAQTQDATRHGRSSSNISSAIVRPAPGATPLRDGRDAREDWSEGEEDR